MQLRPNNRSSWIKTDSLKYYYTTEEDDTPQLNFRNSSVVEEFTKVLTSILELGAKGFRLAGIPRLLVDETFANESIDMTKASDLTHESYGFYKHSRTENLEELGPLVKVWRKVVKAKTENGPLFLKENLETLTPYNVTGSLVVDLPRQTEVFDDVSNADEFLVKLNATLEELKGTWPLWEVRYHRFCCIIIDSFVCFLVQHNFLAARRLGHRHIPFARS